jgi:hypothetical protein
MFKKRKYLLLISLPILAGILALGLIVATLPTMRERLAYRYDQISTRLFYFFSPPEKAVFRPQEQQGTAVAYTLTAAALLTPTRIPETLTPTGISSATPTQSPTPLPISVSLEGVRYMDQHGLWNYCAPANLAMLLSYWGWGGSRLDTGKWLKPFDDDLNVMPYEMADYVSSNTNFGSVVRSGGTLNLLKTLLASGYPVLIEKGTSIRETSTGRTSWMGHYAVLTGYDDTKSEFLSKDSYYSPPDYPNPYPVPFNKLEAEWRSFNYVFVVVYPKEKESQVLAVLGDWASPDKAEQIAADRAAQESATLEGNERFFAMYNRGTSLVRLQDYNGAASSFDQAFQYYETLPEETRPFRIVWYQTGPYFAYYFTGRYQDVINLATTTLDAMHKPYLEESYYWRARAESALGDQENAIKDLCFSLQYHPNFPPSMDEMQRMGLTSCP